MEAGKGPASPPFGSPPVAAPSTSNCKDVSFSPGRSSFLFKPYFHFPGDVRAPSFPKKEVKVPNGTRSGVTVEILASRRLQCPSFIIVTAQ